MPPNEQEPGRESLPHLPPLEVVNQTTLLFITCCVDKRRPLLARKESVELLLQCWREADDWLVERWVVMPEHLHLFCAPRKHPTTPLKAWMQFWRSLATRRWPFLSEKPIWQRDFFDRRLRNGESYQQQWLYLWENPIKEGLVERPEDWPHQGEMNVLAWHEPA